MPTAVEKLVFDSDQSKTNDGTQLDQIPTLPENTALGYLAEGAANVVFRLSLPSDYVCSSFDPIFALTRLLRLRKTIASAQPALETYHYLSTRAIGLFPPHLIVPTSLVRLPPSFLSRENTHLKRLEATGLRPKKRHGMYLEEAETYGLLVADMSPRRISCHGGTNDSGTRQILVEFKPKWVVQSCSAPVDSARCRTCALRLQRAAMGKASLQGFCPLDLASGDPVRVRRAVKGLLPTRQPSEFHLADPVSLEPKVWEGEGGEAEVLENLVVDFILSSDLMPRLKALQTRLDPDGPLKSAMSDEFLDAMTIRDLTMFLRVDMDSLRVEARMGDLDRKTKENEKGRYWKDIEAGLVDGGWYQATEKAGDNEWRSWKCQFA